MGIRDRLAAIEEFFEQPVLPPVAGMLVAPLGVRLPDVDQRTLEGRTIRRQYLTAQVQDLGTRRAGDQVVGSIAGADGIERPGEVAGRFLPL